MSGTWRTWRRQRERVLVVGDRPEKWQQGNYVPALLAVAKRAAGLGGVWVVEVAHDPTCSFLHGGICDCQPVVRLRGDPRDN